MRGPKVPNHKILGAKHIRLYKNSKFFCQPEVKVSGLVPRGFYGTALQSNLDFSNLITFLCTFEYVYHNYVYQLCFLPSPLIYFGQFVFRNGKGWVHVSCALWIPEVGFGNVRKMEPVTRIEHIPVS